MQRAESVASSGTINTSNVWLPQRLLHGISKNIYQYNPREDEVENKATTSLRDVVAGPSEAILANNVVRRLTSQSVNPTFDGHSWHGNTVNHLGRQSLKVAPKTPWPDTAQQYRRQHGVNRTSQDTAKADLQTATPKRYLPFQTEYSFMSNRAQSPVLVQSEKKATTQPDRTHSISPTNQRKSIDSNQGEFVEPLVRPPVAHANGHNNRISYEQDGEISPLRCTSSCFGASSRHQTHAMRPADHRSSNANTYHTGWRPSIAFGPSTNSANVTTQAKNKSRTTSIWNTYQRAIVRKEQLERSKAFQMLFQYATYLFLVSFVYFILVGRPLWGGVVWYIYVVFEYHLTFIGGSAIFLGLAAFYAAGPLLTFFETPVTSSNAVRAGLIPSAPRFPPAPFVRIFETTTTPSFNLEKLGEDDRAWDETSEESSQKDARANTALLIPCYKSANLLPATLEAALKTFAATNIFVLANGNSPVPLDDTEAVCDKFGVNHTWIPIGSKIVAQYVGCYVARQFPYCLLIDDDCILPPEFPLVIDRLQTDPYTGKPSRCKCLGYTITSIGQNRSKGTWCQQAQDLEYKLSGLQRQFAGEIGSATFPHGAIVLWDTEFLIQTFKEHPGFSVSEDWFFGHVARQLGSRITMCSLIFVETETPSNLFFSSGGARGGFGEMTVFKQRFKRWNFFFVNGMYYNLHYILFSWKLGVWELGTKVFVFQEVYETILYLVTPIVFPISFIVRPAYTAYLFSGTFGLYLLTTVIFNELHLRLVDRQVSRRVLLLYYMPFKIAMTVINVTSCWWSLWMYAKYFAKRHPRIIEDERAVGVVLKIQEASRTTSTADQLGQGNASVNLLGSEEGTLDLRRNDSRVTTRRQSSLNAGEQGLRPRRLTVTAVKVDVLDTLVADSLVTEAGDVINIEPVEQADEIVEQHGQRQQPGVVVQDFAVLAALQEEDEDDVGGYSYYGI